MRERPAAVVVETAVTQDHGSETGAVFRPDPTAGGNMFDVAQIACRASAALAQEPDPLDSTLWQVSLLCPNCKLACHAALAQDLAPSHRQ